MSTQQVRIVLQPCHFLRYKCIVIYSPTLIFIFSRFFCTDMTSSSTALHNNGAPCGVESKSTGETMNSSADDRKNTNWPNVLFYIYLHLSALYAIILIFREAHWFTIGFAFLICLIAPYGVTVGAHRLWAHSSYKASLPLRLLLCFLHTLNAQGSVYDWVLEHRLHHKLRGTPQDPYNPKRGFLFAHINNRFKKRTEEREQLEKEIDMNDLEQDSIVMFQKQ
ncbi:hypothetical protein B566_EDAN006742 [Ephemera danica]|nr:hypothetical protein B566_EDAN006742 [Ephemera danica]